MQTDELEYVGFWQRVGASLIDMVLLSIITIPILVVFYGDSFWLSDEIFLGPMDIILSWVFPVVVTILFWVSKQATPGKMAISAKIVDARTGCAPTTGQFIGRYFAYSLSIIFVGLGIIWIAFDGRKQGLHDILAGTVVVRKKYRQPKPVSFDD